MTDAVAYEALDLLRALLAEGDPFDPTFLKCVYCEIAWEKGGWHKSGCLWQRAKDFLERMKESKA